MSWVNWFKQKFASHEQTVAAPHAEPLISITIVPSVHKEAPPVVESEIVFAHAHEKINVPQQDCFPELAVFREEYRLWRQKVQQIMRENKSCDYNPAAVGNLLMSVIEQWLHHDGKVLMHFPEYGALMSAHARFHRCAGAILVQHQRGEFLNAINMLRCDFEARANEVEQALGNLLRRAKRDYCAPACADCQQRMRPTTH